MSLKTRMRWVRYALVLILMVGVGAAWVAANNAAQIREGNYKLLIDNLLAEGKTVDFLFDQPITGTVRTISTRETQITVGDDYVCFATTWNENQVRQYCSPFTNVVSITYVE